MKFPGDIAAAEEDPRRAASWPYTRFQVAALYGMAAKEAGETANQKMQVLGISWLSFEGVRIEYRGKNQHEHYQIIFEATLAKVEQNSRVRELLLETGDLVLRPDHYVEPGAVTPASRYNEIAMKIRSQLRAS